MTEYVFHILKINLIAAVIVSLTVLVSRLTKQKYSLKWKYYMWMAVAVFLLIPVNFSAKSPVRLQIEKPGVYRQNTVRTEANAARTNAEQEIRAEGLAQEEAYIAIKIPSEKVSVYGILEIFRIIWMAGIFISAVAKALRYHFSLHKMMRWSYPVEDKRVRELYRFICLKKHIRRPPGLFISPELSTPVLAGLRRTGLYLTEEEYDMDELKFILSHELTHYKRGDLWYKMLLMAANTIYWFNPALYWMRSEAEKDIENLCDGDVVEKYTKEEQMKYGRLLRKTAALQNHVPYLAASLNDSTLIFKERILYMRNMQHLKKNVLSVVVLTGVMASSQLLIGSTVTEAESRDSVPFTGMLQTPLPDSQDGQPVNASPDLSAEQITLYAVGANGANYVNKADDGYWYDGSGRQYTEDGAGGWACLTDGTSWTDEAPESPADHAITQRTVTEAAEGYIQMILYQQADGSWQNSAGGIFTDNGDGTWTGMDGTVWHSN